MPSRCPSVWQGRWKNTLGILTVQCIDVRNHRECHIVNKPDFIVWDDEAEECIIAGTGIATGRDKTPCVYCDETRQHLHCANCGVVLRRGNNHYDLISEMFICKTNQQFQDYQANVALAIKNSSH